MDVAELAKLEYQIDALLAQLERLRTQNVTLQQKVKASTETEHLLTQKNRYFADKIRHILAQLKGESA